MGYVGVSINYRLLEFDQSEKETTTATPVFPAQIHDCKAAIRWLRANAAAHRVDASRIGVIGGSAGGHLSLLVGLSDSKSDLEGNGGHPNHSSRVHAVVNVFGVTDMAEYHRQTHTRWILRLLLGGTLAEAAKNYQAASPTNYVSRDDPPVLTIHGELDSVVPVSQAKRLDEAMKRVGASHKLVVLKGQDHGPTTMNLQQTQSAIWSFFSQQLK